jgi:hypothetical protein
MEDLYSPREDERFGYMYHVVIYEELLLTYEQALEREHGSVCTSDPDDDTDYDAMKWYKGCSLSFAEKDWKDLIYGIRDHLKKNGPLLEQKGESNRHYFYYFSNDYKSQEKVLKRAWVYITHKATVDYDKEKFAKHLLPVKRI